VRIGRAAGITDTGRRRLRNEDAFVCEPPLFAVADGMGGARAGEVAARLAAAALEEAAPRARGAEGIAELIREANRRVWEHSLGDPATAGMGTTVTAALVDAVTGTVAVGHVGDSRGYLLRDGALEQLTTDHSLVAELVESGVLTPEEAERHPQRSAITRALGTEPTVDVDAFTVEARPADLFLLCSDGLSTMVADEEIASVIEEAGGDPARATEALVAAANARGGQDNVTVVLFELLEGEPTETEATAEDGQAEAPEAAADEPGSGSPDGPATAADEPQAQLARHGAGPGGRVAALLLIAAALLVAVLVLYWGISR
jgi:protein phosphatase